MSVSRNESRDARPAAPSQKVQKPPAHDRAPRDHTTLSFEGHMAVYDDETGGDPYNRSGRFRRAIR